MSALNHFLVIMNQKSRLGQINIRKHLKPLEVDGYHLHIHQLKRPGQIHHLIKKNAQRVRGVIIGGGDGTINSAVDTLVRYKLPLGILPLGTANDLARTLGIIEDIDSAVSVIRSGYLRFIDLGRVNDKYFFNAAHIGLSVKVASELSPALKRKWGGVSYPLELFHAFWANRSFRAHIDVNGKKISGRFIQLTVSNGKYFGGGNKIREDATIDDNLFDIILIKPQTFFQMLTLIPKIFTGFTEQANDKIIVLRSHELFIKTRRKKSIVTDGEITKKTPAHFVVQAKKLSIYAPLNILNTERRPGDE